MEYEILKDPNILGRVEQLRDKCVSTESICVSDVVSLESFLGFGLITKTININKFTSSNSVHCLEEAVDVLNKTIGEYKKVELEKHYTLVDLVNHIETAQYYIRQLVGKLNAFSNLSSDIWDRIFNEKYVYYYKSDTDNSEYVDIYNFTKDQDIIKAFSYNRSYLIGICTTSDGVLDSETMDRIYNRVNELFEIANDEIDLRLYPLFCVLGNDKENSITEWLHGRLEDIKMEKYTIEKLYKNIYLNVGTIIKDLEQYSTDLGYTLNSTKHQDFFNWYTKNDINNMCKRIENVTNILKDNNTLNSLEIINMLGNKN